jgi:sugar transferase (PEP-CTERM system associated)
LIRFLNAYFPKRTFFLGVSEACLVAFAFFIATVVRLGIVNAGIVLSDEQGFLKIILVSGFVVVCMYYFDLYDPSVLANYGEVLTRVIQTLGTLSILLAFIFSLYPAFELGRGIFLIGCALVGFFLLCWRGVFFKFSALPHFAERVLILGNSELSDFLASQLPFRKELGFNVVGHIKHLQSRNEDLSFATNEQSEEIVRSIEPYRPDRIVVAMGDRRGKLPVDALLQLKTRGINIQDGVELYEAVTGKIPVESLRLGWLLFSPGFRLSVPIVIYKRVFSVFFAIVGLILASPLMILVALAVRWSSAGPVIFRQKRVGQNGKTFTLYKFRTMLDGADEDGNYRPAESNDARFTRVGRILRRTRVDELPQLFNILRGDMHFVGPRPFVPNQEEACLERIPYYRQRWAAKPGATGWAQVNKGYCASIEDNIDKLGYDLFYIKNMSIGLDLLILFKTTKILLLGRGAQ